MGTIFEKWITNGTTAPFYARKQFFISKEIKKAEANVCGLGQHVYTGDVLALSVL